MDAREQAVIEAMARLVLAQDALKRASGAPGVLAEILAATSLVAEAQGWLQSARRAA